MCSRHFSQSFRFLLLFPVDILLLLLFLLVLFSHGDVGEKFSRRRTFSLAVIKILPTRSALMRSSQDYERLEMRSFYKYGNVIRLIVTRLLSFLLDRSQCAPDPCRQHKRSLMNFLIIIPT